MHKVKKCIKHVKIITFIVVPVQGNYEIEQLSIEFKKMLFSVVQSMMSLLILEF